MFKFFDEEESKLAVGFPPLSLASAFASQALSDGHLETLYRSSSTDFLLRYSVHSMLDIKTYGSHYLNMGCKGWRGQSRKREIKTECHKLNIQERTLDILPMQKEARRRCADWYLPSGKKHNGQNESFWFTWVRSLISSWQRLNYTAWVAQWQKKKQHKGKCEPTNMHADEWHLYAGALTRFTTGQFWLEEECHIECYCFYLPSTLTRPPNTFTWPYKSKQCFYFVLKICLILFCFFSNVPAKTWWQDGTWVSEFLSWLCVFQCSSVAFLGPALRSLQDVWLTQFPAAFAGDSHLRLILLSAGG